MSGDTYNMGKLGSLYVLYPHDACLLLKPEVARMDAASVVVVGAVGCRLEVSGR